jgi:hypothetical protein
MINTTYAMLFFWLTLAYTVLYRQRIFIRKKIIKISIIAVYTFKIRAHVFYIQRL